MARKSYVQHPETLELIEKDQYVPPARRLAIYGDLPDFVSPIDGKTYSGRAGLREHCRLHNVVPTADCAGLPTTLPAPRPDRAAIRETLTDVAYGRIPVRR